MAKLDLEQLLRDLTGTLAALRSHAEARRHRRLRALWTHAHGGPDAAPNRRLLHNAHRIVLEGESRRRHTQPA